MKLILILILVAGGSTEKINVCNTCIKFDNLCHNVSYLLDLPAKFREQVVIKEIEVLKTKRILYYSYEPELQDPEYYKTGFINLDDHRKNGSIGSEGVTYNFGTFSIDQENEIIYLGGSTGVFQMSETIKPQPYVGQREEMACVFFKDYIYYVKTSENKIRKFVNNDYLEHIPSVHVGRVKNFVITRDNFTVFLNTTGLYIVNYYDNTVKLSKNAFIRGLSIDKNNLVYAWWIDEIYKVVINTKLEDTKLVKVASIPTIGALTFDDSNNIIYTSDKSVFKLIKMDVNTTC